MMSIKKKRIVAVLGALVATVTIACVVVIADTGESGRENGSEGAGEEGGTRIGPDQMFIEQRKGTVLILGYVPEARAFVGVVGNISDSNLQQVRVEVHLFNRNNELGPTTPVDLAPGQWIPVWLPDEGSPFTEWVPHAEVGASSGSGREGGGEHGAGGEGRGEHGAGGEHGSGGEGGGN